MHPRLLAAVRRRSPRSPCSCSAALVWSLSSLTAQARADGPGSGSPWTASVGDSYISGEAGRWAGNTNGSSSKIDALGSKAYDDNAGGNGRTDRRLPPLQSGRGLHRRRRQRREPRLLGRQDVDVQRRQHVQAGSRLLQLRRQRRPGADAPALRRDAQRQARGRVDRRQQLQLREHRADVRRGLAAVAVVVAELLQRRQLGDEQLHVEQRQQSQGRNHDGDQKRRAGDDQRRATPARSTRSSCRTIRRRFRSARASATPRAATRARKSAAAASGTTTPTTPTKKCCRRSTARCSRRPPRRACPNVKTLELGSAFNGRRLCEKGVGLLEEQGLSSWKGAGAVDKTEWINQIRTVTAIFPPYEIQEDIHPNYWGELALRNCLTQAYNAGTPQGRHVHDLLDRRERAPASRTCRCTERRAHGDGRRPAAARRRRGRAVRRLGVPACCEDGAVSASRASDGPRMTAVMREDERVTPLELFFDLVFVLALTQCTTLIAHDADLGGHAQGPARARDAVVVVGRLRVADERRRSRGGRGAPGDLRRDGRVPRRGAVRARRVRRRGAAVRVRVRGGAHRAHRAVHARQPRRRGAAPVGARARRQHGGRRGAAVRRGGHVGRGAGRASGGWRCCSTRAARCCSARTAGSSCPATSPSATG